MSGEHPNNIIVAQSEEADRVALSQSDHSGIVMTARRRFTTLGMSLAQSSTKSPAGRAAEAQPMGRRRINQTVVKTSTGIWSVQYNAENRPVTFTNNESNTVVECTYDSMGRRATKQVIHNGSVTLHQRCIYRCYLQIAACDQMRISHPCLWLITWDPTQPVATRPLAIQKDGTWYCYGWDLTKNICEVFGQHGYIRTTYAYTPYGAVTADGDVTQPLQWSSECADTELGLVYYNYRYYNPVNGRWLFRDAKRELTNLKLYIDTNNSPIVQWDYIGNDVPYILPGVQMLLPKLMEKFFLLIFLRQKKRKYGKSNATLIEKGMSPEIIRLVQYALWEAKLGFMLLATIFPCIFLLTL